MPAAALSHEKLVWYYPQNAAQRGTKNAKVLRGNRYSFVSHSIWTRANIYIKLACD